MPVYGSVEDDDSTQPHQLTNLRDLDYAPTYALSAAPLKGRAQARRVRVGVAAVLGAAVFAAFYSTVSHSPTSASSGSLDAAPSAVDGSDASLIGAPEGRPHVSLETTDAGTAWLDVHAIQFTAGGSRQPGATGYPTYNNKSYLFETYYDEGILLSDLPGDGVDVVVEETTCNSYLTTRNDTDYGGKSTISKIRSDHDDIIELYAYQGAPAGIELVQTTGHLYWADKEKGVVYRGCVDGYVDAACDLVEIVEDVPLVADLSILLDTDEQCDWIYMAIPETGIYRANCTGHHKEEIVSSDVAGQDVMTVFIHEASDLVYWASGGDVYHANMVTGNDTTLVFNSTTHFSLTNGTAIEFITIIDDTLLMSSETMSEIYFLDLGGADASPGRLLRHHKVHGITDAYDCSTTDSPTTHPSMEPTNEPTHRPTHPSPTAPHPTAAPGDPTTLPSPKPTHHPSPKPTHHPSPVPTIPAPSPVPTIPPKEAEYTFCESTEIYLEQHPALRIASGGFNFSDSYEDFACLAKPTEYTDTNLVHSDYAMQNMTVNVTFVKDTNSKGQVMAVGLRSTQNDNAWGYGYCQGYQKYLCNVQIKNLKKAKLEFKICGSNGLYEDLYVTELVAFSTQHSYKLSFSALGDALHCQLYDTEDYAAGPLLDHTVNASEVHRIAGNEIVSKAGGGEFGSYSSTQYFTNFDVYNHDEGTYLQYAQ